MPSCWGHGLSDKTFLAKFPHVKIMSGYALINGSSVRKFTGDCGTLTLHNISYIDKATLKTVKEMASENGYDTIIATGVDMEQKQRQLFMDEGWVIPYHGYSNRKGTNYSKEVYILRIDNCAYKGYWGKE